MVLVCSISRSQRLKKDFQDKNFENLLVRNHKAKRLDICHETSSSDPLPSLFKLCRGGQKWPRLGCHMLYIGSYSEKHEKIFLSEIIWPRYLVCSITW